MKPRAIQEMIDSKQEIERGSKAPAQVWELRPNGKGGFSRRSVDPQKFQQAQKVAWEESISATREKLGLSQNGFAQMLGISVRTLHHWEQGTRTPSGAARVLLRVAAENPEIVIKAAA